MRSDGWFIRIWKLIYPLIVYFAINLVLVTLISGVWIWRLTTANPNLDDVRLLQLYQQQVMNYQMAIVLGVDLIIAAVLWIFYSRDSRRLVPVHKKTNPVHWILVTLLGIFGGLAGNFIVILSGLIQLFPDVYEEMAEIQYSGPVWIQFLSMGLAAPIMEEILFRGLIFRRLRTYCKFPVALIVSSFIFGLCHGNILQFFYAFLLGLLMGLLYERFRTLWAPIAFHAAANLFSVAVTNYTIINIIISSSPLLSVVLSFGMVVVIVYLFNTTLKPEEERRETINDSNSVL